uniref:Uncharacterized protein n=1 Tax=Arundo donax TaxID=35708 RepID=A0A0A9EGJ3_ARUDO
MLSVSTEDLNRLLALLCFLFLRGFSEANSNLLDPKHKLTTGYATCFFDLVSLFLCKLPTLGPLSNT